MEFERNKRRQNKILLWLPAVQYGTNLPEINAQLSVHDYGGRNSIETSVIHSTLTRLTAQCHFTIFSSHKSWQHYAIYFSKCITVRSQGSTFAKFLSFFLSLLIFTAFYLPTVGAEVTVALL